MPLKRIIVHIGSFKTGSTSIQASLQLNEGKLAEQGILAQPEFFGSVRDLTAPFRMMGKGGKPEKKLPRGHFRKKGKRYWKEVTSFLKNTDAETAVFSSEFLIRVHDAAEVREWFETYAPDVHVVAYVRDPVSHFVSHIQQWAKGGHTLANIAARAVVPDKSSRGYGNYAEAFGKDAVTIRHFHPDNLHNKDVVQDFYQIVAHHASGFEPDVLTPAPRKNESLPGAVVAWLIQTNELLGPEGKTSQRTNMVRSYKASDDITALPRLRLEDPDIISTLRYHSQDHVRWLNDTFLKGQVLLPAEPAGATRLDETQMFERLSEWLKSTLDRRAIETLWQRSVLPDPHAKTLASHDEDDDLD